MIKWMPLTRAISLIHFGLKFKKIVAVIHLFHITYLSMCFNQSEKSCKMINYGPKVQRLRNISGTFYKCQDGVYTY